MYSKTVEFFTTKNSLQFEIKSPKKAFLENFLDDLYIIFSTFDADKKIYTINGLQIFEKNIEDKFKNLVEKYQSELPEINGVYSHLIKNRNEYFIFTPQILDKDARLEVNKILKSQVENKTLNEINDELKNSFADLFELYHVYNYGTFRHTFGEKNKNKRICRFCKNTSKPLTFKTKAHAISEALGNKNLIIFEECDECNKKFGKEIEPDIIQYLSIYRTFFNISAKGGSKNFIGKNFSLTNKGQLELKFNNISERPNHLEDKYEVNLRPNSLLNIQNIYKSLCKYFLSVIDGNLLQNFENTIKWINGEIKISKLPKIAETISYDFFTKEPEILVFIRKNNNKSLPYAFCEFRLTCKRIVFIIPMSDLDEKNFTDKYDFDNFWCKIKHYENNKWIFSDFSSAIPKEVNFLLSFNKEK